MCDDLPAKTQEESRRLQLQSQMLQQRAMEMSMRMSGSGGGSRPQQRDASLSGAPAGAVAAVVPLSQVSDLSAVMAAQAGSGPHTGVGGGAPVGQYSEQQQQGYLQQQQQQEEDPPSQANSVLGEAEAYMQAVSGHGLGLQFAGGGVGGWIAGVGLQEDYHTKSDLELGPLSPRQTSSWVLRNEPKRVSLQLQAKAAMHCANALVCREASNASAAAAAAASVVAAASAAAAAAGHLLQAGDSLVPPDGLMPAHPPGDVTPSSVTSSRAGLHWNIPSRGSIPSPGDPSSRGDPRCARHVQLCVPSTTTVVGSPHAPAPALCALS